MSSLPFKKLDNSTVPAMLAYFDSKFYPKPSPGLTARMGVLWALTAIYILLSLNYLYLHVKHSKETPKWRSLWLARFVERPSGRFLVLNPRPTWIAVVISYGFYELFATGMFWRVYCLQRQQDGWAGVRSYNGLALFIGGWCISWSGLQAFLLTTESNGSHLLPAWLANGLFIGGGACLILLHIALAAYTTVLTEELLNRYYALHENLAALNRRLSGATPTAIDLLPIKTLFQPFGRAAQRLITPNCVQYALIATLPLACLMVNIGGLALARKLQIQIKDSVSLLALQDTQHQGTQAAFSNVHAEDFASPDAGRRPSDFDTQSGSHRMISIPLANVITRTTDENKRKLSVGVASDDSGKRKPSLSTNDVKLMARHGNTRGGTAARSQARKVLALQKATRDLIAVTVCIMFIALSLFGYCIWVAWLAGTDLIYEGSWSVTEGSAMICQWIYAVFVCFAVGFLNYNAWMNGREWLAEDLPNATTNGVGVTTFGAGGAGETRPAMATTNEQRVSFISHFVDAGSVEHSVPRPTDYPPLSPTSPNPPTFPPPPKNHSPTTSASSAPSSTTRREVVGERKPSAARFNLPRPHWPFPRQNNSSDTISNGRRRGVGAGHAAGGSATASAIMVTVETDQVCDGDTCAVWFNDQDKAERGESGR